MVVLELNQLAHAREIPLPGFSNLGSCPDTTAVGLSLHNPKRLPLGIIPELRTKSVSRVTRQVECLQTARIGTACEAVLWATNSRGF